MAKRFKALADFNADEQIEYARNGTIPELPDADEEQALRDAGFDPESRRPLADVEAETEKREAREERVRDWEEMSVDDHMKRHAEPWS